MHGLYVLVLAFPFPAPIRLSASFWGEFSLQMQAGHAHTANDAAVMHLSHLPPLWTWEFDGEKKYLVISGVSPLWTRGLVKFRCRLC